MNIATLSGLGDYYGTFNGNPNDPRYNVHPEIDGRWSELEAMKEETPRLFKEMEAALRDQDVSRYEDAKSRLNDMTAPLN